GRKRVRLQIENPVRGSKDRTPPVGGHQAPAPWAALGSEERSFFFSALATRDELLRCSWLQVLQMGAVMLAFRGDFAVLALLTAIIPAPAGAAENQSSSIAVASPKIPS